MNSNIEHSIGKNIMRVLMSNFWVTAIGLVCSFVFPKVMTIEAYALYHTFTLYVGYTAILHLGFPSGMVVNYAGQSYDIIDKKQYKSEVILLILVLFFFTICSGIICLILKKAMPVFVTLSIIPVCITGSYKAIYQAWSQFEKYTRINVFLASSIPLICLIYYFIYKDLPGEIYIISYLLVYAMVSLLILIQEFNNLKGIIANTLVSKVNYSTEKVGILLVLGNYINTLFVSVDKQFIKIFYSSTEFAYYSFAMSMQAIMTVFITSIAQPLLPAMAQGRFKDEDYNSVKELLFIFGSYSGCAYFVTALIVKIFIKRYIDSLAVTGVYFVVFPAMAVISCLFINLYKIKRKTKSYVATLAFVLIIAIILNACVIKIFNDFQWVAIATTVTYYIWLFIGTKQFEFIKITMRDFFYLTAFLLIFFIVTRYLNDYIGLVVYFILITVLVVICYGKRLNKYIELYFNK